MKPTKPNRVPEVLSRLSRVRGESRASLLARAEKAEQERDQALEKARDRECARVMETDRADGISETLREARRHIDELEEKYTDTRLAVARLQAAQRPRPMDETPRDGSTIMLVDIASWIWSKDAWRTDSLHPLRGWLPLPDQYEKSTS